MGCLCKLCNMNQMRHILLTIICGSVWRGGKKCKLIKAIWPKCVNCSAVFTTSCQELEAYLNQAESVSGNNVMENANCSTYSTETTPTTNKGNTLNIDLTDCDSQSVTLTLTNNDLELAPHDGNGCYFVDSDSRYQRLLFIFHTEVTLTTISLRYSNTSLHDSILHLPRLSICNIPRNFDIWGAINENCSRYHEVAALVHNEVQECHENISVIIDSSSKVTINIANGFQIPLIKEHIYCSSKFFDMLILG